MSEAHNLRQEVSNIRASITDNERLIAELKNKLLESLKLLENKLQRIGSQGSSSIDISGLNERITNLERELNNLNSGGTNTVSVSEYNSKIAKIDRLNSAISNLINALNRGEKNLKSYIDEINRIFSS